MGKITETRWGSYNVLYERGGYINIPVENWHLAANITNKPCVVCEVQYGSECIEDDIERR